MRKTAFAGPRMRAYSAPLDPVAGFLRKIVGKGKGGNRKGKRRGKEGDGLV